MNEPVDDLHAILATLPDIEDVRAGRVELTPAQVAAIEKANEISCQLYENVAVFADGLVKWIADVTLPFYKALAKFGRVARQAGLIPGHVPKPYRKDRRIARRQHSKKVKGR